MRVWNLLCVGFLVGHYQAYDSSSTASTTSDLSSTGSTPHPTVPPKLNNAIPNSENAIPKGAAATPTEPSKKKELPTLIRIAESLEAHARLTIGLSIVAELIKPTSRGAIISDFYTINKTSFEDLLGLKEALTRNTIKALDALKIGTGNITATDHLSRVEKLERIYKTMDAIVFPGDKEKEHVDVGRWKKMEKLDLGKLGVYVKNMTEFVSARYVDLNKTFDAAMAMSNFPAELKHVMDQLPYLERIERFHQTYQPVYHLLHLLTEYLKLSESIEPKWLSYVLQHSGNFNTATRVATALETFAHENRSLLMLLHYNLKRDVDGHNLRSHFNEGKQLEVLKRLLEPFFKVAPVIESEVLWNFSTVHRNTFQKQTALFSRLLNTLHSIRIYTENDFDEHFEKFQEWLNPNMSIPQHAEKFSSLYADITSAFNQSRNLTRQVDELKKSEAYKDSLVVSSYIHSMHTYGSSSSYFKTHQGSYAVQKAKQDYEEVHGKLVKMNNKIEDINKLLPNVSDWDGLETTTELWLKKTIEDFAKRVDPVSIGKIKSGLEFSKLHWDTFQSSPTFADFLDSCSQLEKGFASSLKTADFEREPFKQLAEDPFFQKVIDLNEGYGSLKEKLAAGATMFRIFNDVVEKQDKFEEFFRQAELVAEEIQKLDATEEWRFEWILEMKTLDTIKAKYNKMKKQILDRESYYKPESIETIMRVRRLVESLADVPNPGLRVAQWSEFAQKLHPLVNTTKFTSALDGIFDLDFANHQKHVHKAYANLRGLVNFHTTIEAMENAPPKTFWDHHRWPVLYLGFAVFTIGVNCLIYKLSINYFKAKEIEDAKKRRKEEKMRITEKWHEKDRELQAKQAKAKKA